MLAQDFRDDVLRFGERAREKIQQSELRPGLRIVGIELRGLQVVAEGGLPVLLLLLDPADQVIRIGTPGIDLQHVLELDPRLVVIGLRVVGLAFFHVHGLALFLAAACAHHARQRDQQRARRQGLDRGFHSTAPGSHGSGSPTVPGERCQGRADSRRPAPAGAGKARVPARRRIEDEPVSRGPPRSRPRRNRCCPC